MWTNIKNEWKNAFESFANNMQHVTFNNSYYVYVLTDNESERDNALDHRPFPLHSFLCEETVASISIANLQLSIFVLSSKEPAHAKFVLTGIASDIILSNRFLIVTKWNK